METRGRNLAGEGLIFGVLAGIVLLLGELVVAAVARAPAIRPLQMAASVLLGRGAFALESDHAAVPGGAVHLALSALFGLGYSQLMRRASIETTRNYGREALFGVAFGVALWVINFQLIARAAFPWFLDASQPVQAVMHALFFGLPLGLMVAASEKRVAPLSTLTESAA